jgi:UDP-glucose 4-epimerase
MHVLILGGNGFIGSHFVNAAVARGHKVSVLSRKRDPAWHHGRVFHHFPGDIDALTMHPEWLDGVDAVCHAAWSTVPKTAAADPQRDLQENVIGVLKVLEMINAAPSVKQMLFLSSGGAIYGAVDSEEAIKEDCPLNPIGAYGISKLAAEKYCLTYAAEGGVPVTIIRPANPYGRGQSSIGLLGVIATFLHNAKNGSAATIFGDGSIVRDFFSVKDLVGLMLLALEKPAPGIYNCGSGTGVALVDLITAIERVTESRLDLNRLPARPFDPRRIVLDISLARATFGWSPKIELYEGISVFSSYI